MPKIQRGYIIKQAREGEWYRLKVIVKDEQIGRWIKGVNKKPFHSYFRDQYCRLWISGGKNHLYGHREIERRGKYPGEQKGPTALKAFVNWFRSSDTEGFRIHAVTTMSEGYCANFVTRHSWISHRPAQVMQNSRPLASLLGVWRELVPRDTDGTATALYEKQPRLWRKTLKGRTTLTNAFAPPQSSCWATAITRDIGVHIAADMRPVTVVENSSTQDTKYNIPSRAHFARTVIPKLNKESASIRS